MTLNINWGNTLPYKKMHDAGLEFQVETSSGWLPRNPINNVMWLLPVIDICQITYSNAADVYARIHLYEVVQQINHGEWDDEAGERKHIQPEDILLCVSLSANVSERKFNDWFKNRFMNFSSCYEVTESEAKKIYNHAVAFFNREAREVTFEIPADAKPISKED